MLSPALHLPLGFPRSLIIWPFPYIIGRVFAGIAVCLPSRPDRAVTLIHIVPCLPPLCCLTEESLDDACHLESDPFIIAPPGCENPAASCPICRPQCLTERRINHSPSQELSQQRAKTNGLGLPERPIFTQPGKCPSSTPTSRHNLQNLSPHLTFFIQSLHLGHIVRPRLKTFYTVAISVVSMSCCKHIPYFKVLWGKDVSVVRQNLPSKPVQTLDCLRHSKALTQMAFSCPYSTSTSCSGEVLADQMWNVIKNTLGSLDGVSDGLLGFSKHCCLIIFWRNLMVTSVTWIHVNTWEAQTGALTKVVSSSP